VFLLSRRDRYFYDREAVREPHAAKSSMISTTPRKGSGSESKGERFNQWLQDHDGRRLNPSGSNKRSVWTIAARAFAGAHFATFPPALVEPCLLAGTSAAGCCARCGAPWRRVIRVSYRNPGHRSTNGPRSVANRTWTPGFPQRLERQTTTRDWEPTCACPAGETVPCVVLDPFCGSGTTGLVALQHGRGFIGIDLSSAYARMARRRLTDGARTRSGGVVRPQAAGPPGLLAYARTGKTR
jgi:hypothetical protein